MATPFDASSNAGTVTPDMVQTGSDIPAEWKPPRDHRDYVRREEMIPMRDGVKLHTVIISPQGLRDLPILLGRAPFDADKNTSGTSPRLRDAVWPGNTGWADPNLARFPRGHAPFNRVPRGQRSACRHLGLPPNPRAMNFHPPATTGLPADRASRERRAP